MEPFAGTSVRLEIASVFRLVTIANMHSKNICRKDLKLENILLMDLGTGLVKVTDFGLSKQFSSNNLLGTFVGTPVYVAPEIISCCITSTPYTCKSDC